MKTTIALTLVLVACASTQRTYEAEAGYLAQSLECVDKYDKREAIDECRREVRARWGVRDAGSDTGKASTHAPP